MTRLRLLLAVAILALLSLGADARSAPFVKRLRLDRSLESQLTGHAGTDRAGADMEQMPIEMPRGATAKHCAKRCLTTEGCKAWSFDPAGGSASCNPLASPSAPHCFLKHSVAPVSGHPCRTSGTPYLTLQPPAYPKLPASVVRPTGWLKAQLELQVSGLAGHLHLFWPDVANRLNGMVSLGVILQDPVLTAAVTNFTDYLLRHQRADGWLGPEENYDPWPRMLLLYIFQQYSEVNASDTRVIPAMYAYLHFLWNQYTDPKFDPRYDMWTYVRMEDFQTSIEWLYDTHPLDQQQFLLDLNELLYNSSWDWKDYYHNRLPTGDIGHNWNYYDHGVNNGMAIKSAAVQWRQSGDQSDIDSCYERMEKMDRYHGQASGIFSCDECLAGLNPSRGTELCTVVETMFSYGIIFSTLGDLVFADKVEQIAFNALPASMTPDMWAHQYLQQANEMNAVHQDDPWWNTDGGDSNLYGLEPNYGCCTANFPQGWPKYLTASWMLVQGGNSSGILAAFLGPSELDVTLEDPTYGDNEIHIQQVTDYPLKASPDVLFRIQASHPFPLSIRVPGWAVGATLLDERGESHPAANGSVYVYQYAGPDSVEVTLRLPYSFRTVRRFNNAVSVYYGPLLLALDFSFNTTVLRRYAFDSADYQYLPTSQWQYGILLDEANPAASFNVSTAAIPPMPFDPLQPSIIATAWGREISWPMKHDSADEPPVSPVQSKRPLVPVQLIPYGATLLRIAEIPTLAQ